MMLSGGTGNGWMRKCAVLEVRNVVWRRPDADMNVVVLAILGKEWKVDGKGNNECRVLLR